MSKYLHIIIQTLLFILLCGVLGCRDEVVEIEEPPLEEVLKTDDATVQNTLRMLQMDGSFDNILDRSSCISIKLPVDVVVNGRELTINSSNDFELIEQIYDLSNDDEDSLSFTFPITIIFPNYDTDEITNPTEFQNIVSECPNSEDDDIECIDFVYPIEISTYNKDTEIAEVLEFDNDQQLFMYLSELPSHLIAGFRYPLTLTKYTSEQLVVHDNTELNEGILDADGTCDEQDKVPPKEIDEIYDLLLSGIWEITLFADSADKTDDFAEYLFIFNSDSSIIAEINEEQTLGKWELNPAFDHDVVELEFDFETEEPPIVWLNEGWKIRENTNTFIDLFSEDEEDQEKLLTLKKR